MDVADAVVEDVAAPVQLGLFEVIRRAKQDQLSLFGPELFSRNLTYRRFLFLDSFLVNKPDYIEQVLLTHADSYVKSRFVRRLLVPLLGFGLFTAEGDDWRRQRRIAAPAFQHRQILEFTETIALCAATMVERWRARPGPFDLCDEMMRLTLDVITRTMFSTDVGGQIDRIRELVDAAMLDNRPSALDMVGLPDWLPWPKPKSVVEAVAEFDALLMGIIRARRTDGGNRGDLLSRLMAARDPETGQALSDRQLRDEMITIFLAGHETTANALAFAGWLIARHPTVEARLWHEVDRVLQGRRPGSTDLEALGYTRQIFEETIRLYPPAHTISRDAAREDRIGGVRIPKGALVTISSYLTHRNPTLWPDPSRFDPDRFAPDRSAGRHRFAYLPFGAGPRICIGMGFAIAEAQIILATIAQHFQLTLVPGHVVEPVGLITLRTKTGIWVTAKCRSGDRHLAGAGVCSMA